jgi:hypothetical protein
LERRVLITPQSLEAASNVILAMNRNDLSHHQLWRLTVPKMGSSQFFPGSSIRGEPRRCVQEVSLRQRRRTAGQALFVLLFLRQSTSPVYRRYRRRGSIWQEHRRINSQGSKTPLSNLHAVCLASGFTDVHIDAFVMISVAGQYHCCFTTKESHLLIHHGAHHSTANASCS